MTSKNFLDSRFVSGVHVLPPLKTKTLVNINAGDLQVARDGSVVL